MFELQCSVDYTRISCKPLWHPPTVFHPRNHLNFYPAILKSSNAYSTPEGHTRARAHLFVYLFIFIFLSRRRKYRPTVEIRDFSFCTIIAQKTLWNHMHVSRRQATGRVCTDDLPTPSGVSNLGRKHNSKSFSRVLHSWRYHTKLW